MAANNIIQLIITATAEGVKTAAKTVGNALKEGFSKGQAAVKAFSTVTEGVVSKVKSEWVSFTVALGTPILVLKKSIEAALQMQRIESSMKAATGSAAAAGAELRFVGAEADRLGLSLSDTALAYAKFTASTRNTAIEGETTRKVFTGVSEAITALGLTSEESNGIFLALSQMMSKGRIAAEELSGQLGERLPGAVRLTAEAMGLTTQELLKQMQDGKLMSADVLPKLAEQLHKTYGEAASEAAQKGQAEINRFNNELFNMKVALGGSVLPILTGAIRLFEQFPKTIAGIGGTAVLGLTFKKFADVIREVNTQLKNLTTLTITEWAAKAGASFRRLASEVTAVGIAAKAAAIGLLTLGAYELYQGLARLQEWAQKTAKAKAEQEELRESSKKTVEELGKFKKLALPDNLTGKTTDDLNKLSDDLVKAYHYWSALKTLMEAEGNMRMVDEADRKLKEILATTQKVNQALGYGEAKAKPPREKTQEEQEKEKKAAKEAAEAKVEAIDYEWDVRQRRADNFYADMENRAKDTEAWVAGRITELKMQSEKYGLQRTYEQIKAQAEAEAPRMTEVDRMKESLFLKQSYLVESLARAKKEADEKIKYIKQTAQAEEDKAKEIKKVEDDLAKAKIDNYQESLDALKSSLDEALALEKKYAEEIKQLKQEIADIDMSLADKIRALKQRDMTEEAREADLALQAQEKLAAAEEARKAGKPDLARQLAQQAGNIAYGLKDTNQAIDLVTKAAESEKSTIQAQIDAAEENMKAAQDAAQIIEQKMTEIRESVEANPIIVKFAVDSTQLDAVMGRLGQMQRKGYDVNAETLFQDVSAYATGGRLGGYGGGDSIFSLLEPGEWVIRKEAVRHYGDEMFAALNSLSLPSGGFSLARYAEGGSVGPADTVNLNLNMGGNSYHTTTDRDTAEALKRAFGMEYLKTGGYRPSWKK
jgi:tape measure domain-containing protein